MEVYKTVDKEMKERKEQDEKEARKSGTQITLKASFASAEGYASMLKSYLD